MSALLKSGKPAVKSMGVWGGVGMMLTAIALVVTGIGDGTWMEKMPEAISLFLMGLAALGIRKAIG